MDHYGFLIKEIIGLRAGLSDFNGGSNPSAAIILETDLN